jgi:hypothetical protein
VKAHYRYLVPPQNPKLIKIGANDMVTAVPVEHAARITDMAVVRWRAQKHGRIHEQVSVLNLNAAAAPSAASRLSLPPQGRGCGVWGSGGGHTSTGGSTSKSRCLPVDQRLILGRVVEAIENSDSE